MGNTVPNLAALSSEKVRAQLAGIPQQPTTEAAEQLPRKVTVAVRGVPRTIECPSWCVSPHTEKLNFIEDLTHEGEAISLPVRQFDGSTEQILTAQLVQWPFADKGEAYMSVDADGSGECNEYHGPGGLAFADQLVAHAERIRREVGKLNSTVPQAKPAAGCRVAGCDTRFHYEGTCSNILGNLPMGEGGIDVELVSEEGGPVQAAVFGMDLPRDENLLKTSDPAELQALAARFRAFADTVDTAAARLGGQS